MYIYCNSQFIKDTEATISPFDHGFLYGIGVFETFRVYKGFPFLLYDHLNRLQHAIDELEIAYKININEVSDMLQKLIQINHCENEDVTVRFNISAGNGGVGKLLQSYESPNVLCFLRKAPDIQRTEKHAAILQLRRNTPEGKSRLKSHHYLNNILGKRELKDTPDLEGIFLTEQGYVAEGVVSNILWMKNEIMYTPSLETGILNGITRQFAMNCLQLLGIPIQEGLFLQEDLLNASEVIITNSSQEMIPIKTINNHVFQGSNGIMIQRLNELYNQYRTKLLSIDDM